MTDRRSGTRNSAIESRRFVIEDTVMNGARKDRGWRNASGASFGGAVEHVEPQTGTSCACAVRSHRRFLLCVASIAVALACWNAPALAEDESAAKLLEQIDAMVAKPELTDAQMEELEDLIDRYEAAMDKERGGPKVTNPKPKVKPKPKSKSKATPAPRTGKTRGKTIKPKPKSTPRSGTKGRSPRGSSRGKGKTTRPKTPTGRSGSRKLPRGAPAPRVTVEPEFNVDAENILKPFRQRKYEFSIKDGTYAELIEAFARMASLPVIGKAPAGTVTFVSSEVMDFATALARVQMLLFNHPDDKYWLYVKDDAYLEIARVTEIPRDHLPMDMIFRSLADYRNANLKDNELVLLLYTPESGSIADLEPLRDYMPDYVRTAQFSTENAMTVFGLVRDVNKYLQLIDKFNFDARDPRITKEIPVKNVLPSEAINTLKKFVDGFDAARGVKANKRRTGQESIAEAQARGIDAVPFDERKIILVRAMRKKIEEIEEFLEYIDVPASDEHHAPVVIKVQHTDAGELLSVVQSVMGADGSAEVKKAPVRRPKGKTKGKMRRPAPPASGESDGLTMIEWPPANAIILIGEDEKVAAARSLIERFDVPDQTTTVFVELQHREAGELVPLVTQFVQSTAPSLTCTADPAGGSICLTGSPRDIDIAKDLIAKLDRDTGDMPAVHTIRLQNVVPSELISILSTWDADSPAPVRPTRKGKKTTRRSTRRGAGNKFQANDAAGMLYVICNDEEWTGKYKPLIERLDNELESADYEVIALSHADAGEIISSLQIAYGAAKGAASPKYLALPDGVMVMGATLAQLDGMRQMVAQLDVVDDEVRRVFQLQYADPDEIIPIIEKALGGTAAPPRSKKGRAAAAAGKSNVRFAPRGDSLWVWAPARDMEEIAQLVAELDAPDTKREMRVYEFAIGTNVADLANTLRQFFPQHGRVVATSRAGKRRKGGKRKTAISPASSEQQILIVPQPESRKLFVSAPVDVFPDIEETIDKLRFDIELTGLTYKFFAIEKGDPDLIATLVRPIMEAKILELQETGELPVRKGKGKTPLDITPDPAANRIIVTAPAVLMPEIEALIGQLEEGNFGEQVVRRVSLVNATASEMAATINAMISGKAAPPRPARAKKGKQRSKASAAATARTDRGVTVVAAPGDDALVLTGPSDDVDEVESWIKMLDEGATGGKMMKVYHLVNADVEQLADIIMTVLDPAPAGRKVAKPKSDDDIFSLNPGGPRAGGEISLSTDYYTNTMIVWASPRLMDQVDDLVELYEGDKPELVSTPMPSMMIELKYADAYSAKYDLEEVIDVMWSRDKPDVDYIPFQDTLVLKSRNPDEDFPRLTEIIEKYIDKESEGQRIAYKRLSVDNAAVSDVAIELLTRLQSEGIEFEVEGLEPGAQKSLLEILGPENAHNTQITPCVVPSVMTRSLEALAAGAFAQTVPTDTPDTTSNGSASVDKPVEDAIDRLLREKAEEQASKAGKSKLRIVVDLQANSMKLIGSPKMVADVDRIFDIMKKEQGDAPKHPIIRVYKLEHVAPDVASQVLQTMFNAGSGAAGRGRMTPQQLAQQRAAMQRQAQQLAQMQRAQQMNQANQAGQSGGEDGGKNGRRGRGDKDKEGDQKAAAAKPAAPSIQVFPYPALHAIIVKAPLDMFAPIEQLVATIDRKSDSTSDFRFFKIENQRASDVEKQLKTILGLGQKERSRQPRIPQRGRGGNDAAAQAVAEMLRQNINLATAGVEGSVSTTDSVTITSNDMSNTVLVRGPQQILDLCEEIIAKIEEQAPPSKIEKTYELQYADASAVVPQLVKLFARGKGKDAKYHPDDIDAIFIADSFNNAVIVRTLETDLYKIESVLAKLDVPVGEPRFITLTSAKSSIVAKTINEAMGFRKKAGVRVTGDDSSKKLIVVASDKVFARIEKFARDMDTPPDELKIVSYDLKYAKAKDVLQKMNAMVRSLLQQIKGKNIQLDTFSATADERSNSIVVMGGPITHGIVSDVIAKFDVKGGDTTIGTLVVVLKRARARDVANTIKRLFAGRQDGFDPPKAEANDTTNTLFVRGTEAQLEEIRNEVIVKVEEQPEQEERVTRVYPIEYADLNGVRQAISTAFKLKRGAAETERVDVSVESATRSIVVTAKPSRQEKVASLVKSLDTDSGSSTLIRHTYAMKEGKASQVADLITRTIRETRRGRQGPPISVVPNDDLNMLVVTSTQKNYDEFLPLIEKLDQPPVEGGLVPRVYPISFADPSSLIGTINNSFPRLRGQRPEDMVKASYTWGTSSLVVVASDENHEKVAALLAEIDVESSIRRTTHVVHLAEANAEELARNLTNILNRTQRRRRDDQGMAVVADPGTNTLLVFANDAELAKVQELVATLDVKPAFDRKIQSFRLTYAEAYPTREAITQLFGKSRGRRLNPRDEVAVVVDWATNSVVVSASAAKLAEIEEFIKQVDQQSTGGREVHVVTLKYADAQGMVRSLQEMFVKRGRRGEQTISISNAQGTDSLLIKANELEYADILAVVELLDALPDDKNHGVRRFTLKYVDAGEMQTIIEDYLTKPGGRGGRGGRRGRGGAELVGDIRISTMSSSNSLVVTGAEKGLERVAALVKDLDVEVEDAGTAPKIIKLEKALASQVEPTLTKMFVDAVRSRGRGRGRNRNSSQTSTIQTVIVANDASNSLIVRANAADYQLIESLARKLDEIETDDMARVRLIQVAAAFRVGDLAPTIQETLRQATPQTTGSRSSRGGRSGRSGRRSGLVSVEPILASNSLLIAGDPKLLDVAEALIRKIEEQGPAGGRRSIIVNTKNMSADEIKRVIDQLRDQNISNTSRGSRRSGSRSGNRTGRRSRRR